MTILDRIVEKKKEELNSLLIPSERQVDKRKISLSESIAKAVHPLGVIAEVKKASPSKGILTTDFRPVSIAKSYEELQVAGISVLTDEEFFQGHPLFLTDIKKEVNIPILRKDFIIHDKQVTYSDRIGADAILLIAAILDGTQLAELHQQAVELGLDVLVEVHDEQELEKVLTHVTPAMIGVNNRDLSTFETDLATTERLNALIPDDVQLISESGIHSNKDVNFLRQAKVDGLLVGEGFMKSHNKKAFLDSLFRTEDCK
ncbi:indole-3-glycerol phosphate synthase [Salipaludibacillus keqinensis]|uniref:Indole-3-glycerol phosphate synthase n=1 Tax=Salipaludibacillus keqinensis TaxID=2045207 RepID=A0A323TL93_9BACI|nr:indole-3-glycerol phosphate synthase TrpC [Salipaludibacillus keqinensis]PYZ94517.1 indole-3-glycerol phosphate synthase [Salipaludibacillus keqinensis]